MTETKYESFKKATFGLLEAQGNTDTLEALKEIASVVDRLEESEPAKEESDGITKEEFNKVGYLEKLELKKNNPELYKKLSNGGNK